MVGPTNLIDTPLHLIKSRPFTTLMYDVDDKKIALSTLKNGKNENVAILLLKIT